MNCKEFKISSYLRLAELCSASESDKKKHYMEIVEKLLTENEVENGVHSNVSIINTSITAFIKNCKMLNVPVANQTVPSVYAKYQEYCIENGFIPLAKNEFSKRIQGLLNLKAFRKRLPGQKNKTSIFVELWG